MDEAARQGRALASGVGRVTTFLPSSFESGGKADTRQMFTLGVTIAHTANTRSTFPMFFFF
eukprot:scaffold45661_cov52-Phaeocystis_antarctica.AAC.3